MVRTDKVRSRVASDVALSLESETVETPVKPAHPRSKFHTALDARTFVFWDGEGAQTSRDVPQDYVLLGCYNGETHARIIGESLTTAECLAFIIAQGEANPNGIHVAFAFDYDANMILRNLTPAMFQRLRRTNRVRIGAYSVEHIPGKWLRVTRHGNKFMPKRTVTIQDVFGFFQASLVKALKTNIPDHPLMENLAEIEAGKQRRDSFTHEDIEYIEKYWRIENELAYALVNNLRDNMYDERVNFRITKWHGPGALANYVYRTNGIQKHKSETPEPVYDAARYAYAGGRFELFRPGRHVKAYGIDINSAYPNAISLLPSLSEGEWRYVSRPTELVEFGVYHVRQKKWPIARVPSPLFHRDDAGNISFPWVTDGWYWSPEVAHVIGRSGVEIIEGWEYVGWSTRPFGFVRDLYNQRKRLKAEGAGAERAIKLALNSLYGKMAQRAGWERSGHAPTWHQLEWAGWVTSYTRAMLFDVLTRIPWHHMIAVETDGIYTTADPASIGIVHSKELGGWDVTTYDEIYYVQSGIYAIRNGDKWSMKYRGLDGDSLSPEKIADHTRLMLPGVEWPPVVGTTTRFVGYRQALFREEQNRGPMKDHHRRWEKEYKEISVGHVGKRAHSPKLCDACRAGLSAYDAPHDLIIQSRAVMSPEKHRSTRHAIPWLDRQTQSAEQTIEEYARELVGDFHGR